MALSAARSRRRLEPPTMQAQAPEVLREVRRLRHLTRKRRGSPTFADSELRRNLARWASWVRGLLRL
eukprot:4011304-Alexandrium_andersonii.AAC.1